MTNKMKVLLLENSAADAMIVAKEVREVATVDVAINGQMFRQMLGERWDAIVIDLAVPGIGGVEAIKLARERYPDTPVVIVTGSVTPRHADDACKVGASRFFIKELDGVPGLATALVQVHQQAQQAKEIEQLKMHSMRDQRHEILGTLAAGLAHDQNNFLGSIIMGIGILRSKINPADERILDSMEASAKKGSDMVQQMIAFAKGTNGTAFKVVTAEYLLGEVGRMMRYTTAASNIRLSVRTDVGTSSVKCDAVQINTVLLNMSINSRDEMAPYGGELFLEARNTVLNDPPFEGTYVQFSVRDTGRGIPEDALSKIWEPYFSLKGAKGTGLGLAMVKPILRAHHGTVEVKTGPTGTTFNVFLPAYVTEAEIPKVDFDGQGALIVLVDDEEFFRKTLTMLLESANYKVLPACNGPEALSFFRSTERVDLLISDLVMPLMPGEEVLRHLNEQGFTVPTIFITGREFDEMVDPQPTMILHKPFTREELLLAIQNVLKLDRARSSESAELVR